MIPKEPTNEELLDLLRKDRPNQVIHKVLDYRPHPLCGLCDVLYEVDVVMEGQFFETTIKSVHMQGLPYPIKPWSDLQDEWSASTMEEWTKTKWSKDGT